MPYDRSYRALTYDLRDRLKQNYRLAKALPDFLREPIAPALAEQRIRGLLADRDRRFLQIAQTRIFSCPTSPYLKLLRIAGCTFSDLEDQVRRNGLEDTLAFLA